jgi:tetratricopeptide (TPR) repeat protein
MACTDPIAHAAEEASRAQALMDQRRFVEARIAIREAISTRDDEPLYHIIRGRIEFASGRVPAAFDAYNSALALDPSNTEALQAVSSLGLRTGNLRESFVASEALLAISPTDLVGLTDRAIHSMIRNKFDEADGLADRILATDAANEGGTIIKARVAFLKGKHDEALETLDRFSVSKEDTLGIALTRLEIAREQHDAHAMRQLFADLRRLDPDNAELRLDEANFSFKDERPQVGRDLTISLLTQPAPDLKTRNTIFGLWSEYNISALSSSELSQIMSAEPPVRVAVSEFLSRNGNTRQALDVLGVVEGPGAQSIRARVALSKGQLVDGLKFVNAALATDATHCDALAVLGQIQLKRSEPLRALAPAQLAVSECPDKVEAWETGALAYSALKDPENARRMFRQGIAANPQNRELASRYVDWLIAAGRNSEALAVARRLTYQAPALVSGWKLYVSLCDSLQDPCRKVAQEGLISSLVRYGIDLPPGEAPPNGLFGRLVSR